MATLKESIQKASQNPNSEFANELRKRIESGQYSTLAKREGIDISKMVKTQPTVTPASKGGLQSQLESMKNPAGEFVSGFAKEAAQRVASVQQNIGRVASGITDTMIGTKPDESATQLASINATLLKKARELPVGDERRLTLENAIKNNEKALGIYNQEISSRREVESAVSDRPEFLTPQTKTEKAGAGVEQIGEFFIPAGYGLKALNATKVGRALNKAEDLNLVGKATRSLLKGVGEGTEFAVKGVAQKSTDNLETQAKTAGGNFLIGLAMTPVVDAAGAVVKAGLDKVTKRLPERLMSVIFKTSEEDLLAEWKSIAGGKTLNKTLAREALENDIFGSSEKMGVYSIKKLADIEKAVQVESKATTATINIGKEQTNKVISFLRDIAKSYDGPFSTVGPTAEGLATDILNTYKIGGNLNPNLVLKLKRFFDALRVNSSFNINPILSLKQEGLKNAANIFRQKLYDAGFKTAMEQERIFIEAIEALAKDAKNRLNKNVIGLVDLLAGGGGLVSGGPLAGLSAATAIRAFQKPTTITNLARGLYKGGEALKNSKITGKIGNVIRPTTQLTTQGILRKKAND
jgi:hypothetical protein